MEECSREPRQMTISLVNINIVKIQFKYNLLIKDAIKNLPGRKWDKENKWWTLPVNIKLLASLDILKRMNFEILAEVYSVLGSLDVREERLDNLAHASNAEFVTELPLLPYQRAGAEFLREAGSAVLGDDVGLGKTIQTLAVIESRPEVKKVLVFCPSVLKYQWANEIVKFLGSNFSDGERRYKFTQVIDGNGAQRAKQWANAWPYKYYICNYELLLRDIEFMKLIQWDYIVADEATKISNPHAKSSKAIKDLPAKYRLALTGTPISNRADDVWNVVDFVQPGVLGSYNEFVDKYCFRGQFNEILSYSNLEELAKELKRFMIRRMKVDVLKELPEKRIIDVPFKLTDIEQVLYNKIREEILFDIEHTDINKINNPMTIQMMIVKMLRLRQLVDSMELLGEQKISSKLELLQELLKELDGKKIIIFSEFSEMVKILKREIDRSVAIYGEIDNQARQVIVEKFNTDPECKILILSAAGQFGLNLQAAEVVIHYDQPFSYAKLIQREGRAHRMGQKNTVLIYNLLTAIDNKIKKIIDNKVKLSGEVLGDTPPNMAEIREMLTVGDI